MSTYTSSLSPKIARYARYGERVVNLGLLLFAGVVVYIISQVITDAPQMRQNIDLMLDTPLANLSRIHLLSVTVLRFLPDILGLALLLTFRKLFIGIHTGGVFVPDTARYLRIIGWVTVAMAPMRMLGEALSTVLLSWLGTVNTLTVRFSLEDTDVYVVVIGLVLVAVSQIMLEAIRLYDENGSFV